MIQNANLWLIFEGDAKSVSLILCMSLSLCINPRFGFNASLSARSDRRTRGYEVRRPFLRRRKARRNTAVAVRAFDRSQSIRSQLGHSIVKVLKVVKHNLALCAKLWVK
jgi:hypothetical protein